MNAFPIGKGKKEMNKWQKIFCGLGAISTVVLIVFPPQVVSKSTVEFRIITSGYPIDWLRLFMWFLGIVFVTGLGLAINKDEHR